MAAAWEPAPVDLAPGFPGVGTEFPAADSLLASEGMGPFGRLGGMGLAPGLGGSMPMGPLGFGTAGTAATMGQASSVGALVGAAELAGRRPGRGDR